MEITIRDLEVRFPGADAPLLTIDDRRLPAGSRLLLRGASGSGKSTLLHIITGLQRPARGDVLLDGRSLGALGESALCALRRASVGFVFQRLNILDHLTAVENVQLGSPGRALSASDARRALERVAMGAHADKIAWTLSLGEQQRVAVARVLALSPRLIIADEPTSSLDQENAERVLDALFEACGDETTLIVATHDARIVDRFSTRWTVRDGQIDA